MVLCKFISILLTLEVGVATTDGEGSCEVSCDSSTSSLGENLLTLHRRKPLKKLAAMHVLSIPGNSLTTEWNHLIRGKFLWVKFPFLHSKTNLQKLMTSDCPMKCFHHTVWFGDNHTIQVLTGYLLYVTFDLITPFAPKSPEASKMLYHFETGSFEPQDTPQTTWIWMNPAITEC